MKCIRMNLDERMTSTNQKWISNRRALACILGSFLIAAACAFSIGGGESTLFSNTFVDSNEDPTSVKLSRAHSASNRNDHLSRFSGEHQSKRVSIAVFVIELHVFQQEPANQLLLEEFLKQDQPTYPRSHFPEYDRNGSMHGMGPIHLPVLSWKQTRKRDRQLRTNKQIGHNLKQWSATWTILTAA